MVPAQVHPPAVPRWLGVLLAALLVYVVAVGAWMLSGLGGAGVHHYVGLLAGGNDTQLLSRTRVGRDINRHYYTRSEIDHALERPVVADLLRLIRLRNSHPAFNGGFVMTPTPDEALDLRWQNGADFVLLRVDLRSCAYRLEYSREGRRESFVFSAAAEA